MSQVYLGQIILIAGSFTPRGFATCSGQLLSIQQNTALFSLLGTTYGGNGQTTFGLPDLRSRVPVGIGQGPGLTNYVLGQTGGAETVTLTTAQLPAHTHAVNADASPGLVPSPSGANLAEGNSGTGKLPTPVNSYTAGTPASPVVLSANTIALAGNNQPHNNLQPLLALNYCIATQGIFPSRN